MEIKDALAKRDTPLGVLIHDQESGQNLKRIVGDVASLAQDVRAGKGTLGPLFTDDTLYRKAVEAAGSLGSLTPRRGRRRLPPDRPRLAHRGHADRPVAPRDARGCQPGQGHARPPHHRRELYEKLRALVVQIREAVEDAREHAPINQLVNMVGAVF